MPRRCARRVRRAIVALADLAVATVADNEQEQTLSGRVQSLITVDIFVLNELPPGMTCVWPEVPVAMALLCVF